METKMPNLNR